MKKKNEGFTLVELVIAVVILAIAITPLVANFISSSRMNLKARKHLNAMNLAQDIMEGMSQYSVSDNSTYLDSSTTDVNVLVNSGILPKNSSIDSVSLVSSNNGKLVYQIDGVKTIEGGYNTYDLTVTMNPTTVNGSTTAAAKINNQELADITSVDLYFDAVCVIGKDKETESFTKLDEKRINTTTVHYDDKEATYKGKVKRKVILDLSSTNVGGKDNYSVTVKSEYSVIDSVRTSLGFGSTDYTYVDGPYNISKCDVETFPRSVYIYFEGMSDSTTTDIKDTFEINNTTGKPITVYLIRNMEKGTEAYPGVGSYNLNYGSEVFINSKESALPTASPVYNVDLVYNLRYNLVQTENDKIYAEGTYEFLPGKSSSTPTYYSEPRCKIYYNNAVGDTTKVTRDVYEKHIFDGYQKNDKNLLYDVTIQINEAGKTNSLATYTGGLSN